MDLNGFERDFPEGALVAVATEEVTLQQAQAQVGLPDQRGWGHF